MSNVQAVVKIDDIREPAKMLRSVNKNSEAFLGLVESIKRRGFFSSIQVRPDDEPGKYILIDGLQRLTAAREAGLEEINVVVVKGSEIEAMQASLMANVHRVETKAAEYAAYLRQMLTVNPTLTMTQLASQLGKSPSWLNERLSLNNLLSDIGEAVNEGKISLMNAYALAKLPPEEQVAFVEQAMTQSTAEFCPAVNARVKELKEAKKQGKSAKPASDEFNPNPFQRPFASIRNELEESTIAETLVAFAGAQGAVDGFKLALQWVCNVDPKTIEERKAEWDEKQKRKADDKAKRDAEKASKKAEEAAAKRAAMEAKIEAEVTES